MTYLCICPTNSRSNSPDGRASTFSYNGIGQETGENWYTTTTTTGTAAESLGWTYNVAGLMQTASDQNIAAGTSVAEDYFSYDAEGRETSESQEVPGLTTLVAVTDQYTAGNRTELSADIGGTLDFLNNYEYTFSASDNLFGQMSQVTQSGQDGGNDVPDKTVTFSYLADGQFSGIARYASSGTSSGLVATSAYNYNAAGQTTSLTHTGANGTTTYAAYTWTYNTSGEVASFYNDANVAYYSAEDVGSYTYDATGQLTGAAPPSGPANAANSLSNSYDANGNTTSLNGAATAVSADNTLTSDGTYTDTYDADGNLVEQSNSTTRIFYGYDNRNRLTSVVTQTFANCSWFTTSTVNYAYDAFNDLVARTGSQRATPPADWARIFSQFFVYDGANQVLALDQDGNVTDRYLWGPGVNQLLADDNYALGLSSPTIWTLSDNQNSVRDLVSSDGTLQQHIAYSPFGQQIVSSTVGAFTTEAVCAFGYTGAYTDVVTGDVHNGVRWYDPASERWLTQDPAAADENLYRYCGNGPTDGTDPSGLVGPLGLTPFPVGGIHGSAPAAQPAAPAGAPAPPPAAAAVATPQSELKALVAAANAWRKTNQGLFHIRNSLDIAWSDIFIYPPTFLSTSNGNGGPNDCDSQSQALADYLNSKFPNLKFWTVTTIFGKTSPGMVLPFNQENAVWIQVKVGSGNKLPDFVIDVFKPTQWSTEKPLTFQTKKSFCQDYPYDASGGRWK